METTKNVLGLVDHFFRNEFSKAVAFLTNKFGIEMLELAEDAVQEALFKAMQSWPYQGVPEAPTAWIIKVASNKILDHIRRSRKVNYRAEIPDLYTEELQYSDKELKDDMIKMIFACCNPKLSTEYQIILTLKILGGLSIDEIAATLLKKKDAVAKSYTRAKKKFSEENIDLEMPTESQLEERLLRVLKVIYLLFNEGYKSTNHSDIIRKDLCLEAIRLGQLLAENQDFDQSYTHSLLALMLFHAARFDARVDSDGNMITLEKQDRNKWLRPFIDQGNYYLSSIPDKEANNEYFMQAAISGVHCNAATFEETPWEVILELYDHLMIINPNPVIALNRIVAVNKAINPSKALEELVKIENSPTLLHNHLLFAIKAEIMQDLGEIQEARLLTERAIALTSSTNEQDFLKGKLKALEARLGS